MADDRDSNLEIFNAITAILALVVSAFSAFAARRSAIASETSARQAQDSVSQALIMEIVTTAQGVLAEDQRLEAVASRLINEYQSLFALAGRTGAGIESEHIKRIDLKKNELQNQKEEALRFVDDPHSLRNASSEDLALNLAKYQGYLVRRRSLRQEFESELRSVEDQSRLLREKALSKKY